MEEKKGKKRESVGRKNMMGGFRMAGPGRDIKVVELMGLSTGLEDETIILNIERLKSLM